MGARSRQEVNDLERIVTRVSALLAKAAATGDPDSLDGVALNLHAFYPGVEHILETIARETDGAVPGGQEWHRDLLLQTGTPIEDVHALG